MGLICMSPFPIELINLQEVTMDNVVLGAILTVAVAIIVFVFLALRIRNLMNKKPD